MSEYAGSADLMPILRALAKSSFVVGLARTKYTSKCSAIITQELLTECIELGFLELETDAKLFDLGLVKMCLFAGATPLLKYIMESVKLDLQSVIDANTGMWLRNLIDKLISSENCRGQSLARCCEVLREGRHVCLAWFSHRCQVYVRPPPHLRVYFTLTLNTIDAPGNQR